MLLADLTSDTLRELLSLSEKKEALLAQIAKLDIQLEALAGRKFATHVAAKPAKVAEVPRVSKVEKVKTTRQRRGGVRDAILAALISKPDGVCVPELAKVTGFKIPSLHTFFATTGKNIPGLKKVGRGIWSYQPTVAAEAPEASIPAVHPASSGVSGN